MKEITQDEYQVSYDPTTATVACSGTFRLRGLEYTPISAILDEAANAEHETLTLDVRDLRFLNSSGINTLSKFVIRMREHLSSQLVIRGSEQVPWQKKSLKNLQRLLPSLQLEL